MNTKRQAYPLVILQSALIWSGIPVMWSFMPAYFQLNGLTSSQIGILMSLNPIIAILVQPFFGVRVDRSPSKNRFFAILMLGSIGATFVLSFPGASFYLLIANILVLAFFQASLTPISESISLESLEKLKKSYAPSRMGGTIGYSLSAILLGYLMGINSRYMFYCAILISFVHILIILKMNTVKGHQTQENRVPLRVLFQDKTLLLFFLFASVGAMLMNFYYTFVPTHFLKLGGSSHQLGIIFFISAIFEVPFLLFADRIVKKLGNSLLLFISMIIVGLRILLLAIIKDPIYIYPLSALNGLCFIVFNYVIAVYINRTVAKELRTTGQTVLAVFMGSGRVLGTLVGGFMIDQLGMHSTGIISFSVSIAAIVLFVIGNIKLKSSLLQ